MQLKRDYRTDPWNSDRIIQYYKRVGKYFRANDTGWTRITSGVGMPGADLLRLEMTNPGTYPENVKVGSVQVTYYVRLQGRKGAQDI